MAIGLGRGREGEQLESSQAPLNVAILGAGRMGHVRAEAIAVYSRAQLRLTYDPIRDRSNELADRFGATAVGTVDEALSDATIDAVFVCTPSTDHPALVIAAARAGKAIFCEKPLAITAELARAAERSVETTGVIAAIGFSKRFDPGRRLLEDQVRGGSVGEVAMVLLTNRDPNTATYQPLIDYLSEVHDSAPGGLIRESTVHDLDTARALLGEEPVEVFAVGSTRASPAMAAIGELDTVMITLRTAGGRMCQINGSWHADYGYDQRIEVLGTNGMLRLENPPRPAVVRHDQMGAHVGRMFEGPPGTYDFWRYAFAEAYPAETHAFLDVVRARTTPRITIHDGVRAQVLVEATVASWQQGIPIPIPQD